MNGVLRAAESWAVRCWKSGRGRRRGGWRVKSQGHRGHSSSDDLLGSVAGKIIEGGWQHKRKMADFPRKTNHKDGVWSKFSGRVFSFVVDCITFSRFPLLQSQWPVNRKTTQATVSQMLDEVLARQAQNRLDSLPVVCVRFVEVPAERQGFSNIVYEAQTEYSQPVVKRSQ